MSKTVASSNQHVDSLLAGTGKHMKAMAMTLAQHCSGSSSKAAGAWGFQAGPHLTGMLPCRCPPLLPPQPRPRACAAARPAPASGGKLSQWWQDVCPSWRAPALDELRNTHGATPQHMPTVPGQQRAQPQQSCGQKEAVICICPTICICTCTAHTCRCANSGSARRRSRAECTCAMPGKEKGGRDPRGS